MTNQIVSHHGVGLFLSHIGCIYGCVKTLSIKAKLEWVYGLTGHAFALCIQKNLDPSAAFLWEWEKEGYRKHITNSTGYGCEITSFFSRSDDLQLNSIRKRAWEQVKTAIDKKHPCYVWQPGGIPDYGTLHGYNERGYMWRYHFQKPDAKNDITPWNSLGSRDSDVGEFIINIVSPVPTVEQKQSILRALAFAVDFADGKEKPKGLAEDTYTLGFDAYDAWIRALAMGNCEASGNAYSVGAWHEARKNASKFLSIAVNLFDENQDLLDAEKSYKTVTEHLQKLKSIFPMTQGWDESHLKSLEMSSPAISHLRAAAKSEKAGLQSIERFLQSADST
jgi:hypothetical protein